MDNKTLQSQPLPGSQLGFFSQIGRITEGEYKGKVLKVFRNASSLSEAQLLYNAHQKYLSVLEDAGILVPGTKFFYTEGKRPNIYVIQSLFDEDELIRNKVKNDSLDVVQYIIEGLIKEAYQVYQYAQAHPELYLGFHPSLRNYALRDGKLYYLDTFPPMAGIPYKELKSLITDFAPYWWLRMIKSIVKLVYIRRITDEYFYFEDMVKGILGSAVRLRPHDAGTFMQITQDAVKHIASESDYNSVMSIIDKAPRLDVFWKTVRNIINKK